MKKNYDGWCLGLKNETGKIKWLPGTFTACLEDYPRVPPLKGYTSYKVRLVEVK